MSFKGKPRANISNNSGPMAKMESALAGAGAITKPGGYVLAEALEGKRRTEAGLPLDATPAEIKAMEAKEKIAGIYEGAVQTKGDLESVGSIGNIREAQLGTEALRARKRRQRGRRSLLGTGGAELGLTSNKLS